jgi:hypothetical protein
MFWGDNMTIRFNLDKLEAISKGDPKLMRLTLKHFFDKAPARAYHKYTQYRRTEMLGKSYIRNPEPLLNDLLTDPSYIAQYIRLAARRSYMLFKVYGISYLDLSAYPEVDISQISHNPLLTIAKNKVYFKHEEI